MASISNIEAVPAFHPFEGVEKKLLVNFRGTPSHDLGFRSLDREVWDEILAKAQCTILISGSNDWCDAYVLSESSLFVYKNKLLLKTCGTTSLFNALGQIIEVAASLNMEADAVFFNRLNFSYPKAQRFPHQNFEQETAFLDQLFNGSPYILGPLNAERFHLYTAVCAESTYSGGPHLEIQMFDLDEDVMQLYYRGPNDDDGATMTKRGGIEKLIPDSDISEVAFEPCGYSMNGLKDEWYWTIHVTPEKGASYVSFETNVPPTVAEYRELISRVVSTFKPGRFCVSLLHGPSSPIEHPDLISKQFQLAHKSSAVIVGDYVQTYWTYTQPREAKRGVNSPRLQWSKELSASSSRLLGKANSKAEAENLLRQIEVEGSIDVLINKLHIEPEAPGIEVIKDTASFDMADFMRVKAQEGSSLHDDAFFVVDIATVLRKLLEWRRNLPRVTPFYSVKCNPDPVIVKALALLGCGFDCASKNEIEQVLAKGVSAERVVYANPCKAPSHVKFSQSHGVRQMTFDNDAECYKIKELFPDAELILRIITNDSNAKCRLSSKFGATLPEARRLLALTRELGLKVTGISWHVGSGAGDISAYVAALHSTRELFDHAVSLGHEPLTLVDIGGGFPGVDKVDSPLVFSEIASTIRPVIDELFPEEVRIIAEPGRFFVAESHTLATSIIARRAFDNSANERKAIMDVTDSVETVTEHVPEHHPVSSEKLPGTDNERVSYYISDGVYGSFNCILYDHAVVEPLVLSRAAAKSETLPKGELPAHHTSSVFGPTCDELDCVSIKCDLPDLACGDWLYFKNMGAYTLAAASGFNGFQPPHVYYICTNPTA